jgi:predicted enzyme related to lactoylglutathione lyase
MTEPPQARNRPWTRRRAIQALATLAGAAMILSVAEAADAPPLPPLTTVSGNPRLPGKFVWADLVTDDLAAARTFYENLFGWSFREYGGGYVIAANDERPLCGMFQRPRPEDQPQAKPRWIGYISVANVKRAERAVTTAGGRVLAAPRQFPKRGEQALFADLEGALFGVIKSSSGDPEDFLAEPGDWIWMQLMSRDGRKAAEFYRGIADYEVIENQTENRLSDFVLASDGYARATVRTIPPDRAQIIPAWLPFIRVRSVNESVAKAVQLGGRVLLPPSADFRDGKVAVIADPTGAALGLLEWDGKSTDGGQKP